MGTELCERTGIAPGRPAPACGFGVAYGSAQASRLPPRDPLLTRDGVPQRLWVAAKRAPTGRI